MLGRCNSNDQYTKKKNLHKHLYSLIFVWGIGKKEKDYIDDVYSFQCLLTVKIAMKQNAVTAVEPLLSEIGREEVWSFIAVGNISIFVCVKAMVVIFTLD